MIHVFGRSPLSPCGIALITRHSSAAHAPSPRGLESTEVGLPLSCHSVTPVQHLHARSNDISGDDDPIRRVNKPDDAEGAAAHESASPLENVEICSRVLGPPQVVKAGRWTD
jgi:hypothetical protein